MEAYAALLSLSHTLDQILHPSGGWIPHDRKPYESLLAKARFLQDFLEDCSTHFEMGSLESRMTSVAYSAEDLIESHFVDRVLAGSSTDEDGRFKRFSRDFQELIERMDAIWAEVLQIKETMEKRDPQEPLNSLPAAGSSRSTPSDHIIMVGFDKKLIQIMERLTEQQSNCELVAITGMGGIGKTTLAKNIYDDPCIAQHFDLRAWVVISQEFSAQRIILALLQDIDHHIKEESTEKLGEKLYKKLFGKRYLIVMDDMWGVEAWNAIRTFFPNDTEGSKILITTRLFNVAVHCDSSSPFVVEFLDEDQSWSLFCEKVYGQEGCPLGLEKVGMKIAQSCRGLPLALVAIGGMLAKSIRTQEYWEHVAENINAIINSGNDEHCLKLLSLSYHHLPIYLKPCFLYLAIFPEDEEISVSRLIKLWIAEGFLKPIKNKSFEEVAMEYLTDLIDRNLILVRRRGTMGKVKRCAVHDLVRDVCLREARKQNFPCFTRGDNLSSIMPEIKGKQRRLCFHWDGLEENDVLKISEVLERTTFMRSYVCNLLQIPHWIVANLRLLKVLDVCRRFSCEEVMQLVNLRYVCLRSDWHLNPNAFSSLHLFLNLQTIVVHRSSLVNPIILPSAIWEMVQLRHIEFTKVILPDPPSSGNDEQNPFILENLQTLLVLEKLKFTEEVLKRAPSLQKLKISYQDLPKGEAMPLFRLKNIVHLHKLEYLRCRVFYKMAAGELAFPRSLKKLTLCGSKLPWSEMKIIGLLPFLEVLKLEYYAFEGVEWRSSEGEFLQLKLLQINKTNLLHWEAESWHFPCLEHLILRELELKNIPAGIGEMETLRSVELHNCLNSTIVTMKKIVEEQESMGNHDLRVRITIPWKSDYMLNLAADNFQVKVSSR